MSGRLITGTVRARQGDRYVVVMPDESRITIRFEGSEVPQLGADVIGVVAETDGEPHMRLVRDVTRMLLRGRTRMSVAGRPDLTARLLARILEGTGPAAIKPGTGGLIERTPEIDDPDLAWALGFLDPEARKLGIALNAIDPMALAGSDWDERTLTENLLPADAAGEGAALLDLQKLIGAAFSPACRRTIEHLGRGLAVASVDFVMPFSPFSTGFSWSSEIGGAWQGQVPGAPLPGEDARRLCAFRELALAFAPRHLGRVRVDAGVGRHVEEAFADVASAIAFLRDGGDTVSVYRMARLREAALARWDGLGDAPPATHLALGVILSLPSWQDARTAGDVLTMAAGIAKGNTPTTAAKLERAHAKASDAGIFVDLERSPRQLRELLARTYREDLEATVARIAGSPRALARMSRFGTLTAPLGFEDVFDEVLAPFASDDEPGEAFSLGPDPWSAPGASEAPIPR